MRGHQYVSGDEILEHFESSTDESDMGRDKLFISVDLFLAKQMSLGHGINVLAVSLSGGVDSMVLCFILTRLRAKYGIETILGNDCS
jgi:hypothetical protein